MSVTGMLTQSAVFSIPSPPIDHFVIGPVRITLYALCIVAGIVVAVLLTNRRLTRRGAPPWVVIDIVMIAVPLAIVGARIYHVLTHPADYFREGVNPLTALYIWEGGIAIYGALIGGAIGAWIGVRRAGIRFTAFADAVAPGLLLAQAIGRLGNWFNQELFGQPTDAPWGLEIDADNPAFPEGLAAETLFHPVFLYEALWGVVGVVVLLWAGRHLPLQWGRLFGLYLLWYGSGRFAWEMIRLDPSEMFLSIRTNGWAALLGMALGLAIILIQQRRHPEPERSPFRPGREPRVDGEEAPLVTAGVISPR